MSPEEYGRRVERIHRKIGDLTDISVSDPKNLDNLRAALEELRVADEELRQQNEELAAAHLQVEAERRRYHELFELAPDAYVVTNLSGIVSEANRSASRLFGIDPQFMVGKALAAYVEPEDRPRFRTLLHLRSGGETRTTPFKLRTRRGQRLYAELTYSVVEDSEGTPQGFRWLVRDVTDQERLARQIRTLNAELETRVAERTADLRTAQQLSEDLYRREQAARHAAEASEAQSRHVQKLESIGVLAGGIAHDFNNLLHVILGNADIAMSRLPGRSPARGPLEEVVRATIRAADLTRQMLAYSGKGAFVVRHLDLSSEVREMATLLRTAISKQATLVWELEKNLPAVNADATQIRQVVMNLITNASDALQDREGSITLRTGMVHPNELKDNRFGSPVGIPEPAVDTSLPYVYLEVTDTGAGMTPETLQRMFDPFFSTKFSGRGLGLAAVMGIVQSHHGLIRIRTEPGSGTSFQVLLPAVPGTASTIDMPAAARNHWSGTGTVLVVEDELGVREVAERLLQDYGFETLTAGDGREALEVMERARDKVTVVLLDLSMPRMGGQETLRHLRERHPHLPVIMMSGYTEEAVASQFSQQGTGMTAFLQKPFQAEDLMDVLRRTLEATSVAR
jgi:PAS domain S-box-containing protein